MFFSYLKIPITKKKDFFLFVKSYFFVMFRGCPYFLDKALGKVYRKQLRSYDPGKRTKTAKEL